MNDALSSSGAHASGEDKRALQPERWLLIRGLTRGSGHWGEFASSLERRLGDRAKVTAIDIDGNGSLNHMTSATRIESMTDTCRERLRASGIAPPYNVIAVSMGGMVAVDWAARHPHEIARCVLVNTSLRSLNPWYRRLRPTCWRRLLRIALLPMNAQSKESLVLRLTSTNRAAASKVLRQWAALRRERPVSRINAVRQLLAAILFVPSVERPLVPLLLLASRHDALVDARCSMDIARRWRAALEIHSSAGHDLTLDDAPWVVERIVEWLRRPASS